MPLLAISMEGRWSKIISIITKKNCNCNTVLTALPTKRLRTYFLWTCFALRPIASEAARGRYFAGMGSKDFETPLETDPFLPNESVSGGDDDVLEQQSTQDAQSGHRRFRSLGFLPIPSGTRRHKGRHHRHMSSLGQIVEDLSIGLENISEGARVEADILRDGLLRDLREADSGRKFFLDMSLTRSMSMLPEEISDFVEEALDVQVLVEEAPARVPLSCYLSLLSAVVAVSSNGSALKLLNGVHPALKLYWRMTATATALVFFAAKTTYKEGLPRLSKYEWFNFVGAALFYAAHALFFFFALSMTSIGNAVIGANSQAILLILGKLLVGEKVVFLEGGGVFLAFVGVLLCTTDEAREAAVSQSTGEQGSGAEGASSSMGIIGDCLALMSG